MRWVRLKKRKEISSLLKCGKRAYAGTLSVVYAPSEELRMAVCVGKKYGKSVRRNRIKRLLRASFAEVSKEIVPCSVLLIPRVAEEYAFASFSRDLRKIFEREHLIVHPTQSNFPA